MLIFSNAYLTISIINSNFSKELFDKRDLFDFTIVRIPFLNSNVPSKNLFTLISSEVSRFPSITRDKST